MQGFSYHAPDTLQEAIGLLAESHRNGERAQVLAGGTDLLVQMRSVDRSPRNIIDIKKIPETQELSVGADRIFIGAAVSAAVATAHQDLKAALPGGGWL